MQVQVVLQAAIAVATAVLEALAVEDSRAAAGPVAERWVACQVAEG